MSVRDAAGTSDLWARLEREAAALVDSEGGGSYHDRIRAPAETVRRIRPLFPVLGITRLARVTGLDRIGIPVFLAVRPNARTLAVTQGKGIDDDSARASAVMEAAEQATAEAPRVEVRLGSVGELERKDEFFVPPARFVRRGMKVPASHEAIAWVEGVELLSGRPAWAPLDVVRLDFTVEDSDRHPFWQSSDGLASGNCLVEAVLHGLCERIERDASALWTFRSNEQVLAGCVDAESFGDAVLAGLAERVEKANLRLRLFDITSDIGVPVYVAIISELRPTAGEWRHFDMSRGTGCHSVPARAAIRAITEAAQSRLTNISGARDDFAPSQYRQPLKHDLAIFANATPRIKAGIANRPREWPGDYLQSMLKRLSVAGIRSVVAVPLGGEDHRFSVARILITDLEDPPESRHYRPRRRALDAMVAGR